MQQEAIQLTEETNSEAIQLMEETNLEAMHLTELNSEAIQLMEELNSETLHLMEQLDSEDLTNLETTWLTNLPQTTLEDLHLEADLTEQVSWNWELDIILSEINIKYFIFSLKNILIFFNFWFKILI